MPLRAIIAQSVALRCQTHSQGGGQRGGNARRAQYSTVRRQRNSRLAVFSVCRVRSDRRRASEGTVTQDEDSRLNDGPIEWFLVDGVWQPMKMGKRVMIKAL